MVSKGGSQAADGVPAPAVDFLSVSADCHCVLCPTMHACYPFPYQGMYCFRTCPVICVSMAKLTILATSPRHDHIAAYTTSLASTVRTKQITYTLHTATTRKAVETHLEAQ